MQKQKTKYYCNPSYRKRCSFRGKDRRCFWEDTCNQRVDEGEFRKIKKAEPKVQLFYYDII